MSPRPTAVPGKDAWTEDRLSPLPLSGRRGYAMIMSYSDSIGHWAWRKTRLVLRQVHLRGLFQKLKFWNSPRQ
jgi:hypothetical protein